MELKELREREKARYLAVEEYFNLGATSYAFRRIRIKLGCCSKTLKKYIEWYKNNDIAAFSHKNKGTKPTTAISADIKKQIVDIYVEKYLEANFTHYKQILEEDYKIIVSDKTLHNILKARLIVSPYSRKNTKKAMRKQAMKLSQNENLTKAEELMINTSFNIIDGSIAHPHKARSKYFGEQIQMDASEFRWVIGKGFKWHLHIAIDDATSKIVGAYFDEQETLNGYYHVLKIILLEYGIPAKFRTDRRTVFEYESKKKKDEEKDTFTQFKGACNTLGIAIEASSQATFKARVERINRTAQDRIPVELKRNGITTIDEANKFLEKYVKDLNELFAKEDEIYNAKSVFADAPDEESINVILAVISQRKIDSGHCIKFETEYYLPRSLEDNSPIYFIHRTNVLMVRTLDGKLLANINDKLYSLEKVEKQKTVSEEFDMIRKLKKPKVKYIPPPNHPWRQYCKRVYLETHLKEVM